MRLAGAGEAALPYRAFSILCGTLAVVFAARLGARGGRLAGAAAALLAASSTALAYYSSEARGYGPLTAAFLGGWLALEAAQEHGRWRATLVWWLCAALGLCAHVTFVFGWGALLAGSVVALCGDGRGRVLARLLRLHALPALCVLAVYLGFVRRLSIGGGDAWSWKALGIEGSTWIFGLPQSGAYALAGAALLGLALAAEFRPREGRSWVYLVLLVAPPLLTALVLRPQFVALRYFSVPLAATSVLLGSALGRLAARGRTAYLAALGLLGVLVAHNLLRDVALARAGRGHFREALEYVLAHSPGPAPSLSSDLEFDTRLTVEFHARTLGRPLVWRAHPPPEGVDWWIATATEHPPELALGAQRYTLERVYPAAGPSSYTWALYRRAQ